MADYQFKKLTVEIEDRVALVTLNDPDHLNGLGYQMQVDITNAFQMLRVDPEVSAVVLTAAGRAFSAGGDIDEIKNGPFAKMDYVMARNHLDKMLYALYQMEKPVIAAVNGIAAGGGAGLAMLCDFVYASEHAKYTAAFTGIGGSAADSAVAWSLPRIVGVQNAKYLLLTNAKIDAQEMLRLGMVQKVLPAEELVSEALKTAKQLAYGPGLGEAISKNVTDRAFGMSFEQYLDYEAFAMHVVTKSEDLKEGTTAFLEKRRPQFGNI